MTLHHICWSDSWALVKVSQCGCGINNDRFPKWSPKVHASRGRWVGGTEHAPPDRILASSIPFSSDEALQIGELLSLSLKMPENWEKKLSQPFTRFQLGMFYSVIYLFWKIWLVSLKLTVETGVNLKTSSSSGSNHFHTKHEAFMIYCL